VEVIIKKAYPISDYDEGKLDNISTENRGDDD